MPTWQRVIQGSVQSGSGSARSLMLCGREAECGPVQFGGDAQTGRAEGGSYKGSEERNPGPQFTL